MKGILFKPWKAKAISESSPDFVWQTRRLSGLEELNKEPDDWVLSGTRFDGWVFGKAKTEQIITLKPRFQVGDTVYIKEALRKDGLLGDACYDDEYMTPVFRNGIFGKLVKWQWKGYKLSPRFMPAWAARYFIKIKGVGYERLQEITFENCLAEGIVSTEQWLEMSKGDNYKPPEPLHPEDLSNEEADREIERGWIEYTKQAYAMLWDSINPKFPWAGNWWVAVYSFVKVEKPI